MERICRLTVLFFLLLGFVGGGPVGMILPDYEEKSGDLPQPTTACKSCHPQVFTVIDRQLYKHFEGIEEKCTLCHFKIFRRQINIRTFAREHLVELPDLNGPYSYDTRIVLTDRQGNRQVRDLAVVPATLATLPQEDGAGPSFLRLELEGVEQGIFASAVIGWQTDRWTRAVVDYGPSPRYGYSSTRSHFSKDHVVTLDGLSPRNPYYCRVTAIDVFGNKTVSAGISFTPSTPFRTKVNQNREGDQPAIIVINLAGPQEVEPRVAAICSSPTETTVTVEYSRRPIRDQKHFGMDPTNLLDAGLHSCYFCHPNNVSHPVGIKKDGLPQELPVYQKNILVCATCHRPHGSDIPYLARFDHSMKLCVKCHPKKHL